VTPPILEDVGGKLVVIEGLTRCYQCLRTKHKHVTAVVVRNVNVPLPTKQQVSLGDVGIAQTTKKQNELIPGLNKQLLRPIEECMHPI
jgi:hypothetical protein